MNITLPFAQLGEYGTAAIAVVGIVVVVFLFIIVWASRYTKVGPNQVLIVSGRQHRFTDPDGNDLMLHHRYAPVGAAGDEDATP